MLSPVPLCSLPTAPRLVRVGLALHLAGAAPEGGTPVLGAPGPLLLLICVLLQGQQAEFSAVSKLSSVQWLFESFLPAGHRGLRGVGSTMPAGLPGLL